MSQNIDPQALEQILTRLINGLKDELKGEMEAIKKDIVSEIIYNNRNLEKKIDGLGTSSAGPSVSTKKSDSFDLGSSTSFNWVKENLKDYSFQQIVEIFKQIIQKSDVKCESVNSRDFGRNQNSFYQILDSVWDQLSPYLSSNYGDLAQTAIKGVASLLSGFASGK